LAALLTQISIKNVKPAVYWEACINTRAKYAAYFFKRYPKNCIKSGVLKELKHPLAGSNDL
jgi:hypothetical protein